MSRDHPGLKRYPQDKRSATVPNADWMRKFLATIETPPDLFAEVIGPLWDARLEAQEEIAGLREECVALFSALVGPNAPAQSPRLKTQEPATRVISATSRAERMLSLGCAETAPHWLCLLRSRAGMVRCAFPLSDATAGGQRLKRTDEQAQHHAIAVSAVYEHCCAAVAPPGE